MSNLRWLRINKSSLTILPEEMDQFPKLVGVAVDVACGCGLARHLWVGSAVILVIVCVTGL